MANQQVSAKRYTCVNCGRTGVKGYKRDPAYKTDKYVCVSEVQCERRQASNGERREKKKQAKREALKKKKQANREALEQRKQNEKSREQEPDDELIEAIHNAADGDDVATRNGEPYRKYDWDRVRTLFVEGVPADVAEPDGDRDWLNLRELSQRLNIPYQTIASRSSKERWAEKKVAYQAQITRERQQQRAKKLAGAATEFDDRSLTVAQLGVQLVHARLGEIVTDVKDRQQLRANAIAARQQGMPIDPSHLRTAIHSSELERLGKSMQMFQEIGMKALGTDIERHQIDGNINVQGNVSVSEELDRDDPKRLAGFIAAAERSNLFAEVMHELEAAQEEEDNEPGEDEDIVDAELVNESDEPAAEPAAETAEPVGEQPTENVTEQPTENRKKTVNIKTRRK